MNFKKKYLTKNNILCVLIILVTMYIVIAQSHFFTPLIISHTEPEKMNTTGDEAIMISPSKELNKKCYIGSLSDEINDKEYAIGIFNHLCETYGEKNVIITNKHTSNGDSRKGVIAKTAGAFGIVINTEQFNIYAANDVEKAHVIFHEYIHLLMFRHMASAFTMNSKSEELIDEVSKNYSDLTPGNLYPTDYAYASKQEQIAEILGVYLARRSIRLTESNKNSQILVFTTTFEQDIYKQFMNNID